MKRDLLFSFVGHLALFAALGIATGMNRARDTRRPNVITIQIVNPGSPQPAVETPATHLVEPKPRPQVAPEPRPKPKSESQKKESVVKKHGLGARIEGADALGYAYYLNIILAKIADNWVNPYAGQPRTIRATVYFVVEEDGTITGVKLEKGSGDAGYDASCVRALLATEKLPPLPPEYTAGNQLKLHLEFESKP
ncbi:MAG: TonB family protein [candidate division WOR-3 bacterium]